MCFLREREQTEQQSVGIVELEVRKLRGQRNLQLLGTYIVDGYPKAETSVSLSSREIGVAMLFEVARTVYVVGALHP